MQFFTFRQKAIVVFMSAVLSVFAVSAASHAATTVTNSGNANANVNAPDNTLGGSVNAALNANSPVGQAAAAAAVTAESPELRAAVKSVWRLAFDAFWNFLGKMASGFVALFTTSVTVTPAATNGNVNAELNVNAATSANVNQ